MSSRKRRRIWSSLRAAGASALANARAVLTTEPGQSGDAGERAQARTLAGSAAAERAGLAKVAQLRAYYAGPDAARDDEARARFAALWDRADSMSWSDVAGVIRAELGEPGDVFDEIDEPPMASASLGQVHGARVGARDVAVKVQYPGIAEALASDLADDALLRRLLGLPAGRGLGDAAAARLRDMLSRELDYRAEAAAQGRFALAFNEDPTVWIPSVVPELSTERVLTTERARGSSFQVVASTGTAAERERVAHSVASFHWRSVLAHGLVNGDPNPGNVIVPDSGPVAFIDFGAWAELGPDLVEHERRIWRGLLMEDHVRGVELFRTSLVECGLCNVAAMGSANQAEWERVLAQPIMTKGRFRFTPAYAERLVELTSGLLRLGGLSLTPELVILWRARLGVVSLLAGLGVSVDLREIVTPLVR